MAEGAAHLDVFVRSWKTPTIVVSSTVLNFGDSHPGLEKRWNNRRKRRVVDSPLLLPVATMHLARSVGIKKLRESPSKKGLVLELGLPKQRRVPPTQDAMWEPKCERTD